MSPITTRDGQPASGLGPLASAALLAGIAGAIYLAVLPNAVAVAPRRALGAYHQIEAGDLKTIPLRRRLHSNEFRNPGDLVNRYTVSPAAADEPVRAERMGPTLPAGALQNVFAVSVRLNPADAGNRAIAAGSQVELVFTEANAPPAITGVWVLAKPDDSTVVFAIPQDRRNDFAIHFPKGFMLGVSRMMAPR